MIPLRPGICGSSSSGNACRNQAGLSPDCRESPQSAGYNPRRGRISASHDDRVPAAVGDQFSIERIVRYIYILYICHASGHVSKDDLVQFIEMVDPDIVIPVHTDIPEKLKRILPNRNVYVVNDKEPFII